MNNLFSICLLIFLPSTLICQLAQIDFEDQLPDIHEYVSVDRQPIPINLDEIKKEIGYPIEAIKQEIEGLVYTRILVDKHGHYLDHKITRHLHPSIDNAIAYHLPKLKFLPAIKDGQSINFWVNTSFYFDLSELKELGVYQKGIGLFLSQKIKNTKKSKSHMEKGVQYLQNAHYKKAQQAFSKSIATSELSRKHNKQSNIILFYSYLYRAKAHDHLCRQKDALDDYIEAIGIGRLIKDHATKIPNILPFVFLDRGKLYMKIGNPQRALADFQWIRLSFPNHKASTQAQIQSFYCYLQLKHTERAREILHEIDSFISDHSLYTYYLATTYLQEKNYSKGLPLLIPLAENTHSIALRQNIWNDIALIYLHQKKYQQALTAVQSSIDLDASNPTPFYIKAKIILDLEGYVAAFENFQLALMLGLKGNKAEEARSICEQLDISELAMKRHP